MAYFEDLVIEVNSVLNLLIIILILISLYTLRKREKKFDEIIANQQKTAHLATGLVHHWITKLCLRYIDRGFITTTEYNNLFKYLYDPYKDVDDDIMLRALIKRVQQLDVTSPEISDEQIEEDLETIDVLNSQLMVQRKLQFLKESEEELEDSEENE